MTNLNNLIGPDIKLMRSRYDEALNEEKFHYA